MRLTNLSARVGAPRASTSILVCRQVMLCQDRLNGTIRRSGVKNENKGSICSDDDGRCGREC